MHRLHISFEHLRVLIVDDQKETRAVLKAMLREIGINHIFEAADGQLGLKFITQSPDMADVILCDWNMPNMNGAELLKKLRDADNPIPFLMITGRSDRESILEAKDFGVSAYIRKPFKLNELEAKLRIIHEKSLAA